MTTDATIPPAPTPAPPGTVCRKCLHSLKGLESGSVCSECGHPVLAALDPDWWANRPVRRLRRLSAAASLLFVAAPLMGVGVIAECVLARVYFSTVFDTDQFWKLLTLGPARLVQVLGWLAFANFFSRARAVARQLPIPLTMALRFSQLMAFVAFLSFMDQPLLGHLSTPTNSVLRIAACVLGTLVFCGLLLFRIWLEKQTDARPFGMVMKVTVPCLFAYALGSLAPALIGVANLYRAFIGAESDLFVSREQQWVRAVLLALAFFGAAACALAFSGETHRLIKAKKEAA